MLLHCGLFYGMIESFCAHRWKRLWPPTLGVCSVAGFHPECCLSWFVQIVCNEWPKIPLVLSGFWNTVLSDGSKLQGASLFKGRTLSHTYLPYSLANYVSISGRAWFYLLNLVSTTTSVSLFSLLKQACEFQLSFPPLWSCSTRDTAKRYLPRATPSEQPTKSFCELNTAKM